MRASRVWRAVVLTLVIVGAIVTPAQGTPLLGDPHYGTSFGSAGSGNGQFQRPVDIAIDGEGNFWIVDEGNDRVQKVNEAGEYLDQFGSSGTGPGQFGQPASIAIEAAGNLWVTDSYPARIQEFDPEGNYIQTVGSEGSGNGQFSRPEGIAIDSEGFIWVSDTNNGRIQKLDEEGEFVEVISSHGPEEGQLGEPIGIDIGVGGDVFVIDREYGRIVVFNPAGEFVRQWGSQGPFTGQFSHPPALEVDAAGNVWVGDEGYDRIVQFDESEFLLSQFGSYGSGPGQLKVGHPFGIAVGEDGRIWVTDSDNNRIQQWGHPPTCQEGAGETDSDQSLEGGLECEGAGQFEYEVIAVPAHGEISEFDPETGLFTYAPDTGYHGIDRVDFRASSIFGPSHVASFELRVGNIPIAAYSFDDETDDVVEDVFGEHEGTVEGATWTEEGRYGPGLVLDGTSQVTVPDTGGDLDLTGEFTLEAWVRPHFESGAVPLFAKEDSASPYFGYLLYGQLFDSGPFAYLSGSGFKSELSGSKGSTPSNAWTHITLTSGKFQAKLYVNGKLDSTGSAVSVRSTDGPLRIGGFEHYEEYLDGRLDEVRIYDTVLTEAEIERDMAAPLESSPPPDGPIAAYPFDEGEGSVAHDVAREHDGAIEGAEWTDGFFGGALSFDGNGEDSILILAAADLDLTDAFTLEAWVRPAGSGEEEPVITKESGEGSSYALFAGGEEAGVPEGAIDSGEESEARAAAAEAIPAEEWSHLALTLDGEDLKLYVEGELKETVPAATAEPSGGDLRIGGHAALAQYFSGLVDEVRIYDRALNEEEIGDDRETAIGGPQVSLSGPIFAGAPSQLTSPDSDLTVDIHDGGKPISRIELLLDGEPEREISIDEAFTDGAVQGCVGNACHLTYSFMAAADNDFAPGPHVIGVRVVNDEGQATTRSRSVTFDAKAPKLFLSGVLAAADGGALEEEKALLEIEAKDGEGELDSGVESIRIAVDGKVVQVEPFSCEPNCPEPATAEFVYDKSEWGEGPHRVTVYAVDAAGNEAVETILIDAVPISVSPTCPEPTKPEGESMEPITAKAARESLKEKLPGAVGKNTAPLALGPYWEDSGGSFLPAREAFTAGWLAKYPAGEFTVGSAACLTPTASTSAETAADLFPGGSVAIHANSAAQTDTAVRITPLGTAIVENVRGASAPLSFSWKAERGLGEEFEELSNGAYALVKADGLDVEPAEIPAFPAEGNDPEALSKTAVQLEASISEVATANDEVIGQVTAVISPPVAVDGEGKLVEGELSVSGKTITATRPAGSVALVLRMSSAPNPVAMCARTASSYAPAFMAACGPEPSVDSDYVSSFDWLGESVVYALETFAGPSEGKPDSSRLYRAESDGTNRVELTGPGYLYFDPQVSPDETEIVATRCDLDGTDCGIYLMNEDGYEEEEVFADAHTGRDYLPTFGANGEEIYFFRNTPTGANEKALQRQLYYVDADGTNERQVTDVSYATGCPDEPPCNLGVSGALGTPSMSPEGEAVVFTHNGEVWQVDADAEAAELEEMTLLTEFEGEEAALWPSYDPEGTKIVYYYEESPTGGLGDGIFTMNADGSEKARVLAYSAAIGGARAPTMSPQGEEDVGFLHQGSIVAVSNAGLDERVVTEGDERRSLTEMFEDADIADYEMAESLETRLEDLSETLGGSPEFVPLAYSSNDLEINFCLESFKHAKECWAYAQDKDMALEKRGEVFTNRFIFDRATRADAFQHGLWTALMVRDSEDPCPDNDGLIFAIYHEGFLPYSWESDMDIANDVVGAKHVCAHNPNEEWRVCEALRKKSKRSIFIGGHIDPDRWIHENPYRYQHLIFRKLRAELGEGPVIRLNGRTCEPPSPT